MRCGQTITLAGSGSHGIIRIRADSDSWKFHVISVSENFFNNAKIHVHVKNLENENGKIVGVRERVYV